MRNKSVADASNSNRNDMLAPFRGGGGGAFEEMDRMTNQVMSSFGMPSMSKPTIKASMLGI
jgi:hypothetical protein